ncbi:hypothetical protein ABPG72_022690 [Tetrahymena utriculariae]
MKIIKDPVIKQDVYIIRSFMITSVIKLYKNVINQELVIINVAYDNRNNSNSQSRNNNKRYALSNKFRIFLIQFFQRNRNTQSRENQNQQKILKTISSQLVDIGLTNDILGFRFEYDLNKSIYPFQVKQNLTYIVYMAQFQIFDDRNQQNIQLEIRKCQNEQLQEFNCIDFSQLWDKALFRNYLSSTQSSIQIYMYGCYDLDDIKKTIPNNCASQDQIEQIINGYYAGQRIMLQTSQFDASSKNFIKSYRNIFVYSIANQYAFTTIEVQKQKSEIKQSLFLQTEEIFSSPIQYGVYNQNFNKQYCIQTSGIGPYNQFNIIMDEVVQQIKIQYQTIPQVLAMVNSTLTLLMFLGVIGKYLAKKFIMQDLFMLFLRNMYQDSYSQILKFNRFFQNNQEFEFNLDFIESDSDKIMSLNQSFKFLSQICSISYDQKECIIDDRQTNICSSFKQQTKGCKSKIDQNVSTKGSPSQIFKRQINSAITNKSKQKQRFSLKSVQLDNPPIEQSKKFTNAELNRQIFDYYSQKLKIIYYSQISQKIKKLIFKMRLCIRKKELNKLGQSQQIFKTIEEEINKNIDIFQVYKDILFLKKAILKLLKKDQLAALQLIGCS